jgi:hypothetical protein
MGDGQDEGFLVDFNRKLTARYGSRKTYFRTRQVAVGFGLTTPIREADRRDSMLRANPALSTAPGSRAGRRRKKGTLCQVENLLYGFPPARLASFRACRALHEALLVAVGHFPPLSDLGVSCHSLHIPSIVVPDILEAGKKYTRCIVPPNCVVADIAVPDLLQDLRPDFCVTFLVFCYVFRFESNNLRKPTSGVFLPSVLLSGGRRRRRRCRLGWRRWLPHCRFRHGQYQTGRGLERSGGMSRALANQLHSLKPCQLAQPYISQGMRR